MCVCVSKRAGFSERNSQKLTQLMSSINTRAGCPISLCSGTTFESAGQCLHRGYTAVCTHSPRSIATGVIEHGSTAPQALLDRKTVALHKRDVNALSVACMVCPSADQIMCKDRCAQEQRSL